MTIELALYVSFAAGSIDEGSQRFSIVLQNHGTTSRALLPGAFFWKVVRLPSILSRTEATAFPEFPRTKLANEYTIRHFYTKRGTSKEHLFKHESSFYLFTF